MRACVAPLDGEFLKTISGSMCIYVGNSISIGTGVIIFYGLAVLLSARAC